MSTKMLLTVLAISMVTINCEGDDGSDVTNNVQTNNAQNNAQTNNVSAGYECPTASNEVVDITTTTEQGLGLNFKLPKDFVSSVVSADEMSDTLKFVRFDKPFAVTKNAGNYPERLLRLEVEQLGPIATDIFPASYPPPYKPYGLGTSKPADGSEANNAMDAGTMEIDGKSVTIYRMVGEESFAKFTVVRELADGFYQLSVTTNVIKPAPVAVTDIDATCARTYDPIALAVIKSVVAQ